MNTIDFAALTALVTGLVQSVKIATNERFNHLMPLLADLLGAAGGYVFLGGGSQGIAFGLLVGLAASGLYSQASSLRK